MGKKWAILENLSTTPRMVVNPSEGGKSTMKSIDIIFQGCSAMEGGVSASHRPWYYCLYCEGKSHKNLHRTVLTILS